MYMGGDILAYWHITIADSQRHPHTSYNLFINNAFFNTQLLVGEGATIQFTVQQMRLWEPASRKGMPN
jgi:hypothetical protein